MSEPFNPRRHVRLADEVAADLRRQIALTTVGDRIPTEHQLGQRYAVSRTVIREAIAQLKTEGLVEARQGSGVFVAASKTALFRMIGQDRAKAVHTRNVYELRRGVEIAAAGFAAARRTKSDLKRLQAAIEAMGSPATRTWADIDFHVGVAAATRNELYENFVAFLGNALSTTIESAVQNTIDKHPLDQAKVISEHERIFAALATGDAEAARAAMGDHLQSAVDRLAIGDSGRLPVNVQ